MPFDPEQLRKTCVFESCAPMELTAAELPQIEFLATKWHDTRKRLMVAGIVTVLAGVAALFMYASAGIVLIAIGVAAFLWLPELVLAALLLTIALAIGTGAMGYGGYSRLELHGPTRTIKTMKETVQWAKQRLLGRSAS